MAIRPGLAMGVAAVVVFAVISGLGTRGKFAGSRHDSGFRSCRLRLPILAPAG